MSSGSNLRVLYIGSDGRSGSTILERLLGQINDYASVGELYSIWERGFQKNYLCGCGVPFLDCKFWSEVIQQAYGGFDRVNPEEIIALRNSVERLRHVIRRKSTRYRRNLNAYLDVLQPLYQAIHEVTGKRIIIDSSKYPLYNYSLSRIPGMNIYLVHLVRDSRAVAFSWAKKKIEPAMTKNTTYMEQFNSRQASMYWNMNNILLQKMKRINSRYMLLRYEDLILDTPKTLQEISVYSGIPSPDLGFLSGRTAHMKRTHTVSGNPVRFEDVVDLHLDLEWKNKMKVGQKAVITAMTLPFLLKYGYIGGERVTHNA